ncbi:MAG: ATP synthase subunit C [Candidatus Izemoplasmataceae bacterium]
MKALTVLLPLILIVFISLPLIKVFKNQVNKKTARRRLLIHVSLFVVVAIAIFAVALSGGSALVAAEDTNGSDAITGTLAQGLGFISAALATGMSALGAGIAVAAAAPAAIGAFSENEKNFGKALIFVALGEGVAIYGLLISILIINSL